MSNRDAHDEHEGESGPDFFYFEGQLCFLGEELFTPLIALDMDPGEAKRKGFNTVAIKVSLRSDADLHFKEAVTLAHQAQSFGLKIVFDLDFALFGNQRSSIESEALFAMMAFSLKALKEKVLIPFSESVLGVIGFRGGADFYPLLKRDFKLLDSFRIWLSETYTTAEELSLDLNAPAVDFSHLDYAHFETSDAGRFLLSLAFFEMVFNWMERLCDELPANCPLFMLLEIADETSTALKAAMLNRDRLGRVLIAPLGAGELHAGIRLEEMKEPPYAFFGHLLPADTSSQGKTAAILLPSLENKRWIDYKAIGETASYLIEHKIPFRMIPETLLPSEWDDVETLIVAAPLSKEGRRRVMGYLSTEGTLVASSRAHDLHEAVDWQDWTKVLKRKELC